MKKVLKLSVTSQVIETDGKSIQAPRIIFQKYKDGHEDDGSDVIIYRRETPGYVFDLDEEEYFDCLPLPTADEVIFRGKLTDRYTFCEYDDTTAEIGKTYAYWVGRGEIGEALTGPSAIKLRDSRVWWRFDKIIDEAYKLAADFKNTEVREIGKSVLGKPIIALFVGNRTNSISCIGAIHAGESGPEILLTALRNILTKNPSAFDKCGIALLPAVNVDMRDLMAGGAPWYIRKNARGVDINRNFDADWETVGYGYGLSSADPKSPTYRGPHPNSEPETEAVIRFIEAVKPRASFSYHWLCSVCTDRLLATAASKDDAEYTNTLNGISRIYSDGFRKGAKLCNKESTAPNFGSSAGSLSTWLYRRGIPAFDLEMSEDLFEVFPSKYDITTAEMLDRAVAGHTQALLDIAEHYK